MLASQPDLFPVRRHRRESRDHRPDPFQGGPTQAGDAELETKGGKQEWKGTDVCAGGESWRPASRLV